MWRRLLPTDGPLFEPGPNDPVFDLYILIGPLVVAVVGLTGRGPGTEALAAGYVASFAVYVGYRAATYREAE